MNVLHLTLKKKWFDMIASGEKKEEYRECKPYWIHRLTWHEYHHLTINELEKFSPKQVPFKTTFYDVIKFRNGYSSDAPFILCDLLEISIGNGKYKWGATDKCFIIKLGKIITKPQNL